MSTVATSLKMARGQKAWPSALRPGAMLRFLRSREMALGVLALILVAVIVGTMLPQRALTPPREYDAWKAAHPTGSVIAEAMSLTQVYQSWWFLFLLSALFLSLLVCTISRARQVRKLDQVRHREGREAPLWVRSTTNHIAFPVARDSQYTLGPVATALATAHGSARSHARTANT